MLAPTECRASSLTEWASWQGAIKRCCDTIAARSFSNSAMFETIPPPLRYAKLWLAIGWLMIGYVIYESLIPQQWDFDYITPWWDKWSHLVIFAVLMLWFAQIYLRRRQRVWIALSLVGLGIAIEFAQEQTGYRSFEYLDMVADGIGAVIGYGLSWTPLGGSIRFAENLRRS